MDENAVFSRTALGREELLGGQPTLKARPRQVLFLVTEAVALAELRAKLPGCRELEAILSDLCEAGYIVQATSGGHAGDRRPNGMALAREEALAIVRALVGERSPVYARLSSATDRTTFLEAVRMGKKVIAAVSSASRAEQFAAAVESRLAESVSEPP